MIIFFRYPLSYPLPYLLRQRNYKGKNMRITSGRKINQAHYKRIAQLPFWYLSYIFWSFCYILLFSAISSHKCSFSHSDRENIKEIKMGRMSGRETRHKKQFQAKQLPHPYNATAEKNNKKENYVY